MTDSSELVFNRMESDLLKNNSYAYVNYTDLNRIERHMKDLAEEVGLEIETRTDWSSAKYGATIDDFPTVQSLGNRLISNLSQIVAAYQNEFIPPITITRPIPTTLDNMTIYTMNDIEAILYEIEKQTEVSG